MIDNLSPHLKNSLPNVEKRVLIPALRCYEKSMGRLGKTPHTSSGLHINNAAEFVSCSHPSTLKSSALCSGGVHCT
jgi:hypothetical protein